MFRRFPILFLLTVINNDIMMVDITAKNQDFNCSYVKKKCQKTMKGCLYRQQQLILRTWHAHMETAMRKFTYTLHHAYATHTDLIRTHGNTAKLRFLSKSSRDLDLEWTMSNVELIRGLFISYNIIEFQDPRSFIF